LIQAGNSARFLRDAATAVGYYEEAGRVRPDSWIPPYNLACLQAIDGDPRAALALLDEATRLGFARVSLLDDNVDFDSVRALPGWEDLRGQVRMATAVPPRSR